MLLRKLQGCLKKVSSVFQDNSKKVSLVFQECLNEVLFCDFVVAWISSQLPEKKEGLFSQNLLVKNFVANISV